MYFEIVRKEVFLFYWTPLGTTYHINFYSRIQSVMQAKSLSHSPLYSVKLEDGTDEVMNDSPLNFTNIKRSGNVVLCKSLGWVCYQETEELVFILPT